MACFSPLVGPVWLLSWAIGLEKLGKLSFYQWLAHLTFWDWPKSLRLEKTTVKSELKLYRVTYSVTAKAGLVFFPSLESRHSLVWIQLCYLRHRFKLPKFHCMEWLHWDFHNTGKPISLCLPTKRQNGNCHFGVLQMLQALAGAHCCCQLTSAVTRVFQDRTFLAYLIPPACSVV